MAKLLIEVELDDKGSIKTVKKLEAEVKDVGEAADKASTKTEGMTKKFGGLKVGALAAVAGLVAIAKGVGALVNLFGEQEEAEAQLNQTLISTGHAAGLTFGELTKMASGLQEVTKFGDETIIKSQALLLTFTNIGRDIFPDAQEAILNVATAMGTDLQSATVQIGKALNDPVLGMTALSRSGITFTEDQKAVVKAMVKTGDVAGAQAIIMKELNTQFGGQARAAANTFIGSQVQMKNVVGDLGETLGAGFAPLMRATNDLIKEAAIETDIWFKAVLGLKDALEVEELDIQTAGIAALKEEVIALDSLILSLTDDVATGRMTNEEYTESVEALTERSRAASDRLKILKDANKAVESATGTSEIALRKLDAETVVQIELLKKVEPLLKSGKNVIDEKAGATTDAAMASASGAKTEGEAARSSIIAELSRALMTLVRKVMTAIPFPFNVPASAVAVVALKRAVERNIPKFALGGSALVGGSGLTDDELITLRATRGETLRVTTPEQESDMVGGDTYIFDMRESVIGQGAIEEIDAKIAELGEIGRSKALKVI